jgi:hypothetical protein
LRPVTAAPRIADIQTKRVGTRSTASKQPYQVSSNQPLNNRGFGSTEFEFGADSMWDRRAPGAPLLKIDATPSNRAFGEPNGRRKLVLRHQAIDRGAA